ncbi:Voltage-dependent calcium channel gamma-5 subunit [Ilyodon furcidens]|uniref:Voltage-dependent calcium channel gamma-5 subunit n=1 Tax=Ilyodon furcidens TaxID=33524 RepID=A0ABV0TFG0_9TELE
MSLCGRKALTLLSSVFAVCGLGLLGVAVSTDYWLYLEEGVILPLNQSTEMRMSLHSGLWRVCFLAGDEKGRCFTIEYVMPTNVQITSESTVSVLNGGCNVSVPVHEALHSGRNVQTPSRLLPASPQ